MAELSTVVPSISALSVGWSFFTIVEWKTFCQNGFTETYWTFSVSNTF